MTAYLNGELNGLAVILALAAAALYYTIARSITRRRARRALIEPCTDTHEYEASAYQEKP